MWCFLLSHSQEAEGGVKWDWVWPFSLVGGTTVVSSHDTVQHHPPTLCRMWWHQAMFLSFIESLILLVALTCSVPLLAPVRRRRCTEDLWETWLDFRGRDYLGQSHLAMVFLHTKHGQHDFLCFREKKLSSIFRFLFFSSIFRYLESVLHPHSYCSSLVFFHVLSQSTYVFVLFFLQEADCTNVHSKLLICSSDVHWSNVHDGQPGCLLSFVLNHSLGPLTSVLL